MSLFFPEVEQQFRDRFGFAPEIPFPANLEYWTEVFQTCLDENSAKAYREAIDTAKELVGDGEW